MDHQNVRDLASLQIVYGEICAAHYGIANFRAKLVVLLPIASGASYVEIPNHPHLLGSYPGQAQTHGAIDG